MTKDHIVKDFNEELSQLDNLLAEMGGLCEAQLSRAMEAMVKRDVDLASAVIEGDRRIDDLEKQVDSLAINLIALGQPMAADLRMIIASLKVANNLERVGDYAKNIGKRTIALSKSPVISNTANSIQRMSTMVEGMIKNALDALINRDSQRAKDVRISDQEVDQMHSSLFKELLTFMAEDPESISTCTHLLFVAKNLERVGDHMTSVAEQIVFIVEGEILDDERPKKDKTSSTVL
ncbi:MAG: hypothetical protein CFH08_00306 [Alphaproteobacteria bacterium MarineAlpha3_Bin7]|nr:MAG: hypothetical protein CFH08_00306 [Alphaproteobacteria bacterium MarineAlpha3_Bin7]|tara:strand:- start:1567 stop:2271 length:705 start_codon:yes stop_codon:yes gene_type:complete